MNALQNELFSIFLAFDEVCKKLGLTYFAFGGTLLGAVRHKGFIPWDDDMDFLMPRRDYNIFAEKAQELLPYYLFVQTNKTDPLSWFPIIKVRDSRYTQIQNHYRDIPFNHGPWIDVFPLDEMTNDPKILRRYDNYCRRMFDRIDLPLQRRKKMSPILIIKSIIYFFLFPSWRRTVSKLENFNVRHFTKSGYGTHGWGDRVTHMYKLEWFEKTTVLSFEGYPIAVPVSYEAFLEKMYGNWRELPPPDERKGAHDAFVDLSRPYTAYFSN